LITFANDTTVLTDLYEVVLAYMVTLAWVSRVLAPISLCIIILRLSRPSEGSVAKNLT
jgi:hypothetical protein